MARDALDGLEVRFHGRGGQGVVTAAKIFAEAAGKEGKYFQALPEYGGERMGAPIRAYARISSVPIVVHCLVTNPDMVVVLDPTLLEFINVGEGLKPEGILVINTPLSPTEVRCRLGYDRGRIATVDATGIALQSLGRNIPNIPMLGALLKASQAVSEGFLMSVIRDKLGAIMKTSVVEANVRAFELAYAQCQIG